MDLDFDVNDFIKQHPDLPEDIKQDLIEYFKNLKSQNIKINIISQSLSTDKSKNPYNKHQFTINICDSQT